MEKREKKILNLFIDFFLAKRGLELTRPKVSEAIKPRKRQKFAREVVGAKKLNKKYYSRLISFGLPFGLCFGLQMQDDAIGHKNKLFFNASTFAEEQTILVK